MVFGRELAPRCALGIASRLGGGIAEGDSIKSRDFLIISHMASISFSCFACILSTATVTADVIAFTIDCLTARSMEPQERREGKCNIMVLKRETLC